MSRSDPARPGADPQRIAVLEKLRPKAARGGDALWAGVATLDETEVDVLHGVDLETLTAAARAADNRRVAAHG